MKQIGKRIIALAILALFLVSVVPAAFAENADNQNLEISQSSENSMNDTKSAESTNVNAETTNAPIDTAEKQPLFEDKETRIAEGEARLRDTIENLKERITQARERYQLAKQKYEEAKEKYEMQKQKLIEAKEKVQNCMSDDESTECQIGRTNLRINANEHLIKTGEVMEGSLEKLANKVEGSELLTDAEKDNLLAEIEVRKQELTQQMEQMKNSGENITTDELKENIKNLKETWTKTKRDSQKIVAQLTNAKLGELVDNSEEVYKSMSEKIQTMKQEGKDTTELEDIANKYAEQMRNAQKNYETAKNKFGEIKQENYEEKIPEFRNAEKQVRGDLTKSRESLREFTLKYKELNQNTVEEVESKEEE